MLLYNTLGRELQEFIPVEAGKVGFYGCGPTVYNYAHIGNLRAYVTHDVLARTLRARGFDVRHVMNITDVGHLTGDNDEGDDKMLKSAEERGKNVLEIADFYTKAFFTDTDRLNIIRPTIVCKATEHIDDMIALIKRIEANGYTYFAGGNLYFDTAKFADYGKLALLRSEEQKTNARVETDNNKRNSRDFALWFTKSKYENQALVWDSPWGRGYPGWHIECSAMSMKYLGEQFDIHAGGIDHISIHHTNEIAQSESSTGKSPWVRYWIHNEFLVLGRDKMSKSTGGFLTLQTLVDRGYDPLDYRYFLLGAHYRSHVQFSFEALNGAKHARRSLCDRVRALGKKWEKGRKADKTVSSDVALSYLAKFNAAMDEDLSTPRAFAGLFGLLKDAGKGEIDPSAALNVVFQMDEILGLNLRRLIEKDKETSGATDSVDDEVKAAEIKEIEEKIAERAAAKKDKDFVKADAIRAALKAKGIILEDKPNETIWRKLI
ncbi:MAG: cysteine--tRNA ligase [Treponema sp.]|jgi:cysteinyl-tRNA synthetase|nr:cysteine--tRNA ligase [Treponema sp.]